MEIPTDLKARNKTETFTQLRTVLDAYIMCCFQEEITPLTGKQAL
jgi:hypothetical protein